MAAFRFARALNQIFYVGLIVIFALAGVAALLRSVQTPWLLLPYAFAAYLSAISIVFSGQSRFHFPVMPWIMLVDALAIVRFVERYRVRTGPISGER